MKLIIHVDGGARGNPGPAGAGVVIRTEAGEAIHEAGYWLGTQTNNAAEYLGLIRALERVATLGDHALAIRSDSELLVKQITGEYRIKNERLRELYADVQKLLIRTTIWQIRHVRREENQRADELANLAMDRRGDVIVIDRDEPAGSPPASPPAAGASPPAPQADPTPLDPDDADPAARIGAARPVRVTCTHATTAAHCPAHGWYDAALLVRETLPAEVCVHAAHALLPTIIAIKNTEPGEFHAVPALTVRCTHSGCRAVFQVAPSASSNGRH